MDRCRGTFRDGRESGGLSSSGSEGRDRAYTSFVEISWDRYISQEGFGTEYMCLYTADEFEGEFHDCEEGIMEWVPKSHLMDLSLWEGDKIFLKLLKDEEPFFSLKLSYKGEKLVEVRLNGKELKKN